MELLQRAELINAPNNINEEIKGLKCKSGADYVPESITKKLLDYISCAAAMVVLKIFFSLPGVLYY